MTTSGSQSRLVEQHMLLKHHILVNFPFVQCDKCSGVRRCWYSRISLCISVDETISATEGALSLRPSEYALGAMPPRAPASE